MMAYGWGLRCLYVFRVCWLLAGSAQGSVLRGLSSFFAMQGMFGSKAHCFDVGFCPAPDQGVALDPSGLLRP